MRHSSLAGILSIAALSIAATMHAQLPMLHTSGRSIVNANNAVVQLRGVNLGGLFVMEQWMAPLDNSQSNEDTYTAMSELDSRFGVSQEQSLISTYQNSWITAQDFQNIANAGFNVVRVPVWWGQFYNLPLSAVSDSDFRSDAFTALDRIVNLASQYGLYVIIDMHGAVGSQSNNQDTGEQNVNAYWTNGNDQGNTAWLWWQIANHYKGNTTVAGYDLLNEPDNAPSDSAVISAYQSLYNSVRSADPNHMIFIEGCFDQWNWSMLPNPSSEGWTNVVYEMHEYQYNSTQAQVEQGSTNQVNDFNNHADYNVPGLIGEFNDFSNDASTWQYSTNAYNNAGLSWAMWSYKATSGLNPNNWGDYNPTYWATTPNLETDSAATIASDWEQWATSSAFAQNTSLGISGN